MEEQNETLMNITKKKYIINLFIAVSTEFKL